VLLAVRRSAALAYRCCLPLDADFFRLAQHLNEGDYNEYAKPVLAFLREDFGARSLPTLETVFYPTRGV
jgi:hypothetical protein